MNAPRLSIGLPVYNGESYLAASLDSLLAQTFTDFELVISDNASTDSTPEICRAYAARDDRIRYVRQPTNIGAAPNHNAVLALARGHYFAWASHDDLYDPELMRLCVEALDARPELALAHAWDSEVDETGRVVKTDPYVLQTDDPRPWVRLRSLLVTSGGNDYYGVVRTETMRRVGGTGSYYNADRVCVTALALHGSFYQVPRVLYFRRDHPQRASRKPSHHAKAIAFDPRLAERSMLSIYLAYLGGYLTAIRSAPLSSGARLRCWLELVRWLAGKALPRRNTAAGDAARGTVAPATPARGSRPGVRVAAVGYFGVGNLGNEATLDLFQGWLAATAPTATLEVVGIDADAIRRTRGVDATRLMLYRRDLAAGGAHITALKAVCRLLDVLRMFRIAARSDVVVVPGSGALESSLGLPAWGLPLWLAALAAACRVQRKPFVLLCVGAERARDRATRFFHRWTVRLAHSVSVRDERSRQALRALGVRRDDIGLGADLVFALPPQPVVPVRPAHAAVGVMAYYGGPSSPTRGPAMLAHYQDVMSRFVRTLLVGGRDVTLVIGDPADRPVAEAVAAQVADPRASVSPADELGEVTAELATAEVVVASRFHNIVGALRCMRPTVSVGYAAKNADLLRLFGLDGVSQSLDDVDEVALAAQVERALLEADEPTMKAALLDQSDAAQARLADLAGLIVAAEQS